MARLEIFTNRFDEDVMLLNVGKNNIKVEETGKGSPLLLIHGLGMSHKLWRRQVPAFSKYYRTITVDLRGFGESSKPSAPGSYEVSVLAEDLVSLMETLEIPRAHILGTSMGGFIAQTIALDYPELCFSVILCHTSSRMNIPPDILKERLDMLASSSLEDYAKLVVDQAFGPNPDASLKKWISEMVSSNDKNAYSQVLSEGLSDFDLSSRVSEISAPTLVVVGEHDRVIPPDQGRKLAREIRDAELEEIPGVGHLGYSEEPEKFNQIVLKFLSSL